MKHSDKEIIPLYHDNHLLILEKPAGISTQPDFHEKAKKWVKKALNKPGNVFLEPIHRLDKPVGGIIVFAKTSKALSRLNESMRKKEIHKVYLAWVEGVVPECGTLENFLSRGEFRAFESTSGKKAVLHFKRLKIQKNRSLVEVVLETGRYHQIRLQFSLLGHPICGDQKYGAKEKSEKIALHHVQLTFPHPIQKHFLTILASSSF